MLKCLGLGMLLLVACSSEAGSPDGSGGSENGSGATSVASSGNKGTSPGGAATAAAGSSAIAGDGGALPEFGGSGGGSSAGTAGATSGAGGALGGGAMAGSTNSSGAGNGGEIASGGAAVGGGAGGSSGGGTGGGAAGSPAAGAGGTQNVLDPCEGVPHWSPTDKITDYTPRPPDAPGSWRGDLRVFGGILWAAQAAGSCQTYPGRSPNYEGWIKITDCAGGPINEVAACQCTAGACCDECYLRGRWYSCGEAVRYARCTGKAPLSCPGSKPDIEGDYWNLFCSGDSAGECTRWGAHTKFAGAEQCGSKGLVCAEQGDQASCVVCK